MGVVALTKKIFFAILAVLVVLSLGRRVWKNLEGVRRVSSLKKDVSHLVTENERLKESLSERMGLEFVETEAREKLGMVKEGETLVILSGEDKPGMVESAVFDSEKEIQYWREWVGVFGF